MRLHRKVPMLFADNGLDFVQTTYAGKPVYGVTWTKADVPLVRSNASVGMVANVGVDATPATNDFDSVDIFGDIVDVTDSLGNEFSRIPAHYVKKTRTPTLWADQISYAKLPGSYKPWCFYDFVNQKWNDYVYIGKYPAGTTLVGGTKLSSLPNEYPLVNKNIVDFRTYAMANGAGYHQLDIHVMDMLQTLFTIEHATLDSQSKMAAWTNGNYNAAHTLTADTTAANTIVVLNATGAAFAVGQPVALGTAVGNTSVFYGRNITNIQVDTPGAGSTTITVDGATFSAVIGNVLWNCGWKSGYSSGIVASSGSLSNNTNGKNPFVYRGIENLYGNVWQFVDGYNINDYQGWFCKDATQYVSNVFASPYEKIGYVNEDVDGYVKYMGFDPSNPMIEIPVDVSSNLYKDYYYRAVGQKIAVVGGSWNGGGYAGLWNWALINSSASTGVSVGGRLCTKAVV